MTEVEVSAIPVGGLPAHSGALTATPYEQLPGYLQDVLRARVDRLGYLGAFFAFGALQPRALYHFVMFTEELRSSAPPRFSDVVALVVSRHWGNEYEYVQHVRLAATHGRSDEWIAAASGISDAAPLDSCERATRDLVIAIVANGGHGVRDKIEYLCREIGEETAVGVLLLACRYIGHTHVANALELTAPERRT